MPANPARAFVKYIGKLLFALNARVNKTSDCEQNGCHRRANAIMPILDESGGASLLRHAVFTFTFVPILIELQCRITRDSHLSSLSPSSSPFSLALQVVNFPMRTRKSETRVKTLAQ